MNSWTIILYRAVGFSVLLAAIVESVNGELWRGATLTLLSLAVLVDVQGWENVNTYLDRNISDDQTAQQDRRRIPDVLIAIDAVAILLWTVASIYATGRVGPLDIDRAQMFFALYALGPVAFWTVLWLPVSWTDDLWKAIREAWDYPDRPRKWAICLRTIGLYLITSLIALGLSFNLHPFPGFVSDEWKDTALWLSVFLFFYAGVGPVVRRKRFRIIWMVLPLVVLILCWTT